MDFYTRDERSRYKKHDNYGHSIFRAHTDVLAFHITGVEPWTFYFLNGFLNFNLVFPMALLALPACVSIIND